MTSNEMPEPPVRPLPDAPFVSLTEAKSWLAFGTALPKNEFMHHVASGSFGLEVDAQRKSQQALDMILDGVVRGTLQMQAEPSESGTYRPGVPRDITPEEARVYREFYEPDECLWYLDAKNPDGSITLSAILNDTEDTRRKFFNVAVNRAQLLSLMSLPAPSEIWTNDTMETWWKKHGFTNGKKARDAFMKRDDTAGLSASFAASWREGHPGRERGRPKKFRN